MQLKYRHVRGNEPGPQLLILAGVHGDEFEPMVAVRELMGCLDPRRLRGSVLLVPVTNEGAFLRGSRTADDELDLARTFPGHATGTLTERVAHAATQLIRSSDFMIDLHTGGTQLAVLPLVGYMMHADSQVLAQQRTMARAFGLPIIWGSSAALEGRSLSVCRDAHIPAIYAEHGGSAVCRESGVAAYVRGCQQVMQVLGMYPRGSDAAAIPHPVEPVTAEPLLVEDHRPQSGHMQVCNPAPCTGYWRPVIELGQFVTKGECLGTISDPLGQDLVPVHCQQTGLVIVLRTFPRVLENDALAVVLETDIG